MDLIIGGAYQGKLTLAAREYGLTPGDIAIWRQVSRRWAPGAISIWRS